MPKAIIIGAGIGGLSTAIALKAIGWETAVYEKSVGLSEVGAGIVIWANGIKVLRKMGFDDDTLSSVAPEVAVNIWNIKGELLASIPSEKLHAFGAPTRIFHRPQLQKMLFDQAGGSGNVQFGKKIVDLHQSENEVSATFEDGSIESGDLLIGSDGIHSVVRNLLFGKQPIRYAGYCAWRGVVRYESSRVPLGEGWGIGERMGISRLGDGQVYWFAVKNMPEGESDTIADRKLKLLHLFKDWPSAVLDLIKATPDDQILRHDLYDLKPLSHWSSGRVTLLGDAAHATLPDLGQGACQSMEDAYSLTHSLSQDVSIEVALGNYENSRIPRTSRVIRRSRAVGWIGQWENPVACTLRDTAMKAMPTPLRLGLFSPFAGYDPLI